MKSLRSFDISKHSPAGSVVTVVVRLQHNGSGTIFRLPDACHVQENKQRNGVSEFVPGLIHGLMIFTRVSHWSFGRVYTI